MTIVRRFPVAAEYALRISHIALWMAIPSVFWLWLWSEPPAECVPQYGWYQGNVLCVSEDAHLSITSGLFLLGFPVIACWIYGYSFDVFSRALQGEKPPPLRMMSAVEGAGLFVMSLKYWRPMIAYLIVITFLAGTLPLATRNHSYHALLMLAAPVALLMYWGSLVGWARYAVLGEETSLYLRRENMRLALSQVKATLALTGALIAATVLGVFAWSISSVLLAGSGELDFVVVAAFGSLGFYFMLICVSIASSHLTAQYAIEIGIGSPIKDGERCD